MRPAFVSFKDLRTYINNNSSITIKIPEVVTGKEFWNWVSSIHTSSGNRLELKEMKSKLIMEYDGVRWEINDLRIVSGLNTDKYQISVKDQD